MVHTYIYTNTYGIHINIHTYIWPGMRFKNVKHIYGFTIKFFRLAVKQKRFSRAALIIVIW